MHTFPLQYDTLLPPGTHRIDITLLCAPQRDSFRTFMKDLIQSEKAQIILPEDPHIGTDAPFSQSPKKLNAGWKNIETANRKRQAKKLRREFK